jgi:hypothetical protein
MQAGLPEIQNIQPGVIETQKRRIQLKQNGIALSNTIRQYGNRFQCVNDVTLNPNCVTLSMVYSITFE